MHGLCAQGRADACSDYAAGVMATAHLCFSTTDLCDSVSERLELLSRVPVAPNFVVFDMLGSAEIAGRGQQVGLQQQVFKLPWVA
jgi:hypothetical protein